MTEGNVTMSAGDLVKRRFSGPLRRAWRRICYQSMAGCWRLWQC